MTKVGVVVPSGDTVHSRFMISLISLFQYTQPDVDLVIINPRSSSIAQGRSVGVEIAKQRGVDYILFLDSDMIFPYTTLSGLLSRGKDVVGATYVKRLLPTSLNHYELDGTSPVGEKRTVEPYVGSGLREVARLPTGVLLIKMSVFDDLEKPYFQMSYKDGEEIAEDFYFCDRVRGKGGTVWLDADLSKHIGHLGTYSHTLDDLAPKGDLP